MENQLELRIKNLEEQAKKNPPSAAISRPLFHTIKRVASDLSLDATSYTLSMEL